MEDLPNCLTPLSSSSSSSEPDPFSTISDLWRMAEQRVHEILCTVRPNVVSDNRRNEIINYVQKLFRFCGTEVFPFGSVPLKTYLPDGDIDLTALCYPNAEEDLASNICCILKAEEHNAEYQVKDVQYIHAQVKVVKCRILGIPVDISFNQVAGLCALSFLEQVDLLVGNNHLFKRSIILIKSWCYYESRILGAHHGLISTYALEMLVLYIFNLFHSSLSGPLEVLHKFLEYYSVFDWDNYCVTINGPVAISSLPGNLETLEYDGNNLLFTKDLMGYWRHLYSVPTVWGNEFPIKHLNILDPLNDNNNLGRSVSRGNFHRIRCAFSYGAMQLKQILTLPGETLGDGLENFFTNTLDRNGRGQRPDIMFPVPAFGCGRTHVADLNSECESHQNSMLYGQWYRNYTSEITMLASPLTPWQIQNWNPLVFGEWMALHRWNSLPQWNPDSFGPFAPFYLQNAPHLSGVNLAEVRRSRGTGTYIPRRTDDAGPSRPGSYYRGGLPPRLRPRYHETTARNHETTTRLSPVRTQSSGLVNVDTQTDELENRSSILDVSLEALSLKETNTMQNQSGVESQTEGSSAGLEVGTSQCSPPPVVTQLREANDASTSSSLHGALSVKVEKQDDPQGSCSASETGK